MINKQAVLLHDIAQGTKGPLPPDCKAATCLGYMFGNAHPRALFHIETVFERRQDLMFNGQFEWRCMVARSRLHVKGFFKDTVELHAPLPIIVYGAPLWQSLRADRRSGCSYSTAYFQWLFFSGRWWMNIPHYKEAFWRAAKNRANAAWYGRQFVAKKGLPYEDPNGLAPVEAGLLERTE